MSARPLVSVLLLLALMLERFAYYAFRSQFVAVQVARGLERSEVLALYSTFTNVVTLLPIVFACIAIVAPRVWMAPVGALIALGGYLTAIMGPQETFPLGVMVIGLGAALMKVTIVCAAADFVDSARARTVVGVVGYGLINLGALLGPLVIPAATEGFSKAPVVAVVLLTVACCGSLVLGQVLPKPAAAPEPTAMGLLGVLLLVPVNAFLWLMVESQPYDLELPTWAMTLNPLLLLPASLVLALVLGLVPARAFPWTVLGMLTLSFVFTGLGMVGLKNRDPSVWILVQVVLTAAEVGLGMLVFALALGSTPPRFAPLSVAMISSTTVAVNFLASQPDNVRLPVLVVLGVTSVLALGLFAVLFRFTLGPLGRAETLGPAEVAG